MEDEKTRIHNPVQLALFFWEMKEKHGHICNSKENRLNTPYPQIKKIS